MKAKHASWTSAAHTRTLALRGLCPPRPPNRPWAPKTAMRGPGPVRASDHADTALPTGAMSYVLPPRPVVTPPPPLSLSPSPPQAAPRRLSSPPGRLCRLTAKTGPKKTFLRGQNRIRARPSRPRPRSPHRPPRLRAPLQPPPCRQTHPIPQQPRRLPSRW